MLFIDQLQNKIFLNSVPKRIISLVPSQTELLFDLGLNDEIIGITKFCIHPKDGFKSTIKVGGTKKLDLELIRKLKPDLIIANKEENQKEDIETLMQEFPVWISDIYNLYDALEMIRTVGLMVNKQEKAFNMATEIESAFEKLTLNKSTSKSVTYLIWKDPIMLAGQSTFINQMLSYCGLQNCIVAERYPILSAEELTALNPDVVFLSSEPYPFKEKHLKYFKEICPDAKVKLVDGEMFSWYGSRLLKAATYFKELKRNLF